MRDAGAWRRTARTSARPRRRRAPRPARPRRRPSPRARRPSAPPATRSEHPVREPRAALVEQDQPPHPGQAAIERRQRGPLPRGLEGTDPAVDEDDVQGPVSDHLIGDRVPTDAVDIADRLHPRNIKGQSLYVRLGRDVERRDGVVEGRAAVFGGVDRVAAGVGGRRPGSRELPPSRELRQVGVGAEGRGGFVTPCLRNCSIGSRAAIAASVRGSVPAW